MLRHQCGIGRGVVIHHINDALHTPLMDLLHQVQKILQCAVFRVHGAVIPVGIGAAQASFFVQLPNRVDGHKPYNIHPQCRYPVQVRLYRLKGPLRCVAAYIYFIDHAAPQRIVGIYGHGVSSFIWAFFLGPLHRRRQIGAWNGFCPFCPRQAPACLWPKAVPFTQLAAPHTAGPFFA